MFRQMIRTAVLLLCLVFSANAFAETVVLLSTDGKGENKAIVDKALTEQLEAHPDYEVEPALEMGISDLILGAGCETPDDDCMEQLGELIEADRLVFAKITAGKVLVRIYDFKEKKFLDGGESFEVGDEDAVQAQIKTLLFGESGEIFVDVGPQNAEIFLDGESMGISPQTFQNLSLGKHTILIRSPDGEEQTKEVVLEAGKVEKVSFTVEPAGDTPKIVKLLPGIGVLAIGVAGIAFGAVQSLEIQGYKDELAEVEKPFAIGGPTSKQAKKLKDDGVWDDIHKRARDSSAETLQWVGYGVGALGIGLGTYLLFNALIDSTEVAISPNPSRPSASVKIKF